MADVHPDISTWYFQQPLSDKFPFFPFYTFNKIVPSTIVPPVMRNFVASTYFNLFGGDGKTIRRQFRGDRIRLEIVDRTFPHRHVPPRERAGRDFL